MPRYVPVSFDQVQLDAESQNDRAFILIWSSILEYTLEECIASRLREPANEAEKRLLFAERGIAGTFFEKICLAYFLTIVGSETRRDLDLIRSIRNVAAHNMNEVSFSTAEIANRVREMSILSWTAEQAGLSSEETQRLGKNLRSVFRSACEFYSINFGHRTQEARPDYPKNQLKPSWPLDR